MIGRVRSRLSELWRGPQPPPACDDQDDPGHRGPGRSLGTSQVAVVSTRVAPICRRRLRPGQRQPSKAAVTPSLTLFNARRNAAHRSPGAGEIGISNNELVDKSRCWLGNAPGGEEEMGGSQAGQVRFRAQSRRIPVTLAVVGPVTTLAAIITSASVAGRVAPPQASGSTSPSSPQTTAAAGPPCSTKVLKDEYSWSLDKRSAGMACSGNPTDKTVPVEGSAMGPAR